eukprot:scaffold25644_cov62-Phaeocystis_antarctica.AAC.14
MSRPCAAWTDSLRESAPPCSAAVLPAPQGCRMTVEAPSGSRKAFHRPEPCTPTKTLQRCSLWICSSNGNVSSTSRSAFAPSWRATRSRLRISLRITRLPRRDRTHTFGSSASVVVSGGSPTRRRASERTAE